MELFLQQILDGIVTGSLYAALALSLVLVHRASGIVNFAQGEMAMFGAFIAWQLVNIGLPLIVAALIAIALSFIVGMGVQRFLVAPFSRNSSHLPLIIVTLGLMVLVNGLAGWIWGHMAKDMPELFGEGVVNIGSLSLAAQSVGTLVAVLLSATGLFLLFRKTRFGIYLRAASSNPESASLSGVPVQRMLMTGWGMAAALGTMVAILVAPRLSLEANMMAPLLLYAFAAAVLGGLDSPGGAVLAGLTLGVVENLAGTYISFIGNEFKQGVALLFIIAVLALKPEGLFGTKSVIRV